MAVAKIDSNVTGLRLAYELSPGVLPGTPLWYPMEPNTYGDFGATIKTTPRNPINQSRQAPKGFVTDLDASANFNQDLTQTNMTRHMQGFLFADVREKLTTVPTNGTAITITGVDATTGFAAASGLAGFTTNTLIKTSGFASAANNGLKVVVSSTAGTVVANSQVTEAAPPAAAKIEVVGKQFAAADVAATLNGNLARLTSTANAFSGLGLIPGEWVFVGGDNVANQFAVTHGFARVSSVTAGIIEFDKTDWVPTAEAGTGKSIHIYCGNVIRTEELPANQKRRTVTLERTLGDAGTGTQAEYVVGACPNSLTVNMPQSDKINLDLSYVALDGVQQTGTTGLKAGTRIVETSTDAFNTSSDFSRIKMSLVDATSSNVAPLFAYIMDLTLSLTNNVSVTKALGVLGGFDTSAGMFAATGKMTAYFADVVSVQAVRNNADVTLDVVMAKNNSGMLFDFPLISLGGGNLKVEKDKPISVPLDSNAAQSKYGHTMIYQNFPYLPNLAQ